MANFFFTGILLLGVGVLFVPKSSEFGLIDTLVMIIAAMVFVVEMFYIRYYYYLGNGTQKLYKYARMIYEVIEKD